MNETQLSGMRQVTEESQSIVKRKMTAKEMALTKHNLNRSGTVAVTEGGHQWVWDARFSYWAMWQ